VTPEEIAKYIAMYVTKRNSIVIDAFCGSGGNVIQVILFLYKFSKYCKKVYAIDIDPRKIEICQNNCKVYSCSDNIEFILSDYLETENKLKVYIKII